MKILILSDSHNTKLDFDFSAFDYVIFCGDYETLDPKLLSSNVIYVNGNCDKNTNLIKNIKINNSNILITHGHLFNVKYTLDRLYYKALEDNANIIFYGHTHVCSYKQIDNMTFINPGAYMSGYYAKIIDDKLSFYKDNKVIKTINIKL